MNQESSSTEQIGINDQNHALDSKVARDSKKEFLMGFAPSAQSILRVARRLLIDDGFDALRFERIASESGEGKATIRYHFGDKAGLIAALVELLAHDATVGLLDRSEALPQGSERVAEHVKGTRRLTFNQEYLAFFDVFPHALREYPELRGRMGELYDWYRDMMIRCFGFSGSGQAADAMALASMFIATADGLAIQQALDPEGFDAGPAFDLLRRTVEEVLDSMGAAKQEQE